jgi:hypothetical protein
VKSSLSLIFFDGFEPVVVLLKMLDGGMNRLFQILSADSRGG